jgi:cysteine desulfurase
MKVPPEVAQGAVRFSFGRDNTMEDVECVLSLLPEIVQRLRSISPLYAQKQQKSK